MPSPLQEVTRRRRRQVPPLYVLLAMLGIAVLVVSAIVQLVEAL